MSGKENGSIYESKDGDVKGRLGVGEFVGVGVGRIVCRCMLSLGGVVGGEDGGGGVSLSLLLAGIVGGVVGFSYV
ncbi:hypothetical protein, partial [Staphylococcus epidermidis]|uniref:hypothetical protein n=1 Tax=Staphylococcus epidermidis TaxID=1282 RepID=UPI0037DA3CE0